MNTTEATIAGVVSATVLSNVPEWVLTFGQKLLYGAGFALVTGFAYAAGGWFWSQVIKARKS